MIETKKFLYKLYFSHFALCIPIMLLLLFVIKSAPSFFTILLILVFLTKDNPTNNYFVTKNFEYFLHKKEPPHLVLWFSLSLFPLPHLPFIMLLNTSYYLPTSFFKNSKILLSYLYFLNHPTAINPRPTRRTIIF